MAGMIKTPDRADITAVVRPFLERLRPRDPKVREKLDYAFRYHGRSVELIEVRPRFSGRPGKTECAFAKATHQVSAGGWKVYWKRGTGKWAPYEPAFVKSLDAFLRLVQADELHCFFG